MVEFAHVMATYVRMGLTSEREALSRLDEVEVFLSPRLTVVSHFQALSHCDVTYGVSVYGTCFVAAAREVGVKLVTEEVVLQRTASGLTQSLEEVVAA